MTFKPNHPAWPWLLHRLVHKAMELFVRQPSDKRLIRLDDDISGSSKIHAQPVYEAWVA